MSFLAGKNNSVSHVGEVSYTEDKILIYTLYFSNIAPKVDEQQLRTYFEQYGAVSSLSVICKDSENHKPYRFGFVTFNEPEIASKVLRFAHHIIRNRNLNVRSADSWKQPYLEKRLTSNNTENNSEEENNDNVSILNLHDDVLFLIFQYLPLHEQVKLSTLCVRFDDIFKMIYRVKKSLFIDFVEPLTLMDFRIGLQKVGEYIRHIKFNSGVTMKNFTRFIDFVAQYCKNLKYLQLDTLRFQYLAIFRKISQNLKTIETLELRNCSITDDMLKLIANIPTIEDLDLTRNCELTGQHLNRFKNLKRLVLNDCVNIQPKYFIEMCNQTKNLQELNIRRCERLNHAAFDSMISNLNDINSLTICTCYNTNELAELAKLKSLKHLTINVSNSIPDNLFQKLTELKSDSLETLIITNFFQSFDNQKRILEFKNLKRIDLPFVEHVNGDFLNKLTQLKHLKLLAIPGCDNISETDLLHFIEKTSNIELIDVSKTKLSNEFILKLCDILNNINRLTPLKLHIGCTKIEESIINNPKYIEHRNKLKIEFHASEYVCEMLSDDEFELDDDYDDGDYDNFSLSDDSDSDAWYNFFGADDELDLEYDQLFLQAMYHDNEDPFLLF